MVCGPAAGVRHCRVDRRLTAAVSQVGAHVYGAVVAQGRPQVESYDEGFLDVGEGQRLFWRTCGNPDGVPALVLHGGPGSGCTPWYTSLFDPARYRVVLVDQRGAGRSTPPAADPATDMSANTTGHLLTDIEALREHLGITSWLVLGVSWGSTLALAYAQAHPARVRAVVLAAVTMTRRTDVDWLTRGVGRFFPAQWEAFRDAVPEEHRDGDLAAAYATLLASPDPAVRERAAQDWCTWEDALVSVETGGQRSHRFADPAFRYGFARTVTHYFSHAAWLGEDQLLTGARDLVGIPGVLIHGRLDISGPLGTAWDLHRAWPGSDLVVAEHGGHVTEDITSHVVAATDRLAGSLRPRGSRSAP